tara:strand:+ start:212 stop:472 length:261 start_codon:yes stop_codon:yes gene_type:complete
MFTNAENVYGEIMEEELFLFDMAPPEKDGEIIETDTEYLQIAFDRGEKAEMIKMLEELCDSKKYEVYAELLKQIVKEKYEEINSRL